MMSESEKKNKGRVRLVRHFLKGSLHLFILSILSAMVMQVLTLLIPQVIRNSVDRLNEGVDLRSSAITIIILALLAVLFRYGRIYLNERAAQGMMRTMRNELHQHLGRLPLGWFHENSTGDIIQRCTNDTDRIGTFVSQQLTEVIRILILVVFSFIFMFRMNFTLSLIALLTFPVIVGYSLFFHARIGSRFQVCDEEEGTLSTIAQENLTGIRVVHAFGREKFEQDRFAKQNRIYTDSWMGLMKLLSLFWGCGDLLSGIQVMLIITVGSVLCVRGRMTAGEFIAFLSYNSMMVWPVRSLGRIIAEMSKAGVSIDRIGYILRSVPESQAYRTAEPSIDTLMKGDIVFDHVTFRYSQAPVVDDVSFTIRGGTTVGILGPTGCGKSTLMLLLDRLYDLKEEEGSIRIGGQDIRNLSLKELRSHIGMVLQEPYLFSRSISENIAITKPELSMPEVRHAASTAFLDQAVDSFDKGYDTLVGERGVTLSGGQKQRTAIARMLTQKAPVMVFDDSLSAVDAETDRKIRAALQTETKGATVILISHRITTLIDSDLILVMDKGKIAESGSPEQLYQKKGIYRRIYDLQLGGMEGGVSE